MTDEATITMPLSSYNRQLREQEREIRKLELRADALNDEVVRLYKRLQNAYKEVRDQEVFEAAIEFAYSEMSCYEYCVEVAGHGDKNKRLLHAVKDFLGVEPGRETEYGHLSYRYSEWRKENDR